MPMYLNDWLAVVRKEYLQGYLRQGGSVVKFAITPSEEEGRNLRKGLQQISEEEGYQFVKADAQYTKLHLVDRLFHKIAKQIDWDELAFQYVCSLLTHNGYQIPQNREEFTLQQVAALNEREETLLRRELRTWLEKALYRNSSMSMEFRMAMIRLCLAQLDSGEPNPFLAQAVKEWLCGELRLISSLKEALIFQKVARHNARHMLASLSAWLKLVGKKGLVLSLDISRYLVAKRPAEPGTTLYYTPSATMDMYETLRQFVDGTDEIEGCLMMVSAPGEFLSDERRGLSRYEALKLRIWDDVRDKHRENPFAAMVKLARTDESVPSRISEATISAWAFDEGAILNRRALEALRSGVPNRDAVQVLGCTQPDIEGQFRRMLDSARESGNNGTTTKGILLDGGFGTGKTHVLEYLQHLAVEQHFICSRVVVSKETPLYSLAKVYQAAIESVEVPKKRGGTLAEVAGELNFQSPQYADLYEWVHSSSGELDSRFAATLFLYERMVNDQELSQPLIRFWAGDPIGTPQLKRYLQGCCANHPYTFEKISASDLALQRVKFVSRLMRAAGYAGWIILIDEAELIGRYSLKQRAKSYVEMARWMGHLDSSSYADLGYKSGLATVVALTDDFQSAILEEKGDREKIPATLREGGSMTDVLLADQAEQGMKLIETGRSRLVGPYDRMVEEVHDKIRKIHASAYSWDPPVAQSVERLSSTRMREYVKGWITEWDLKRLAPDESVEIEVTELRQDYSEDTDLEVPTEEEGALSPDQSGEGPALVGAENELQLTHSI